MICERCGEEFAPGPSGGMPVRYCGKKCRRAAKEKRARQRKRTEIALAACTERGKQRWTDEHAASLAAARWAQQFGGNRYPYECACGWWHVTKVAPNAAKRAADIKRILFGGGRSPDSPAGISGPPDGSLRAGSAIIPAL